MLSIVVAPWFYGAAQWQHGKYVILLNIFSAASGIIMMASWKRMSGPALKLWIRAFIFPFSLLLYLLIYTAVSNANGASKFDEISGVITYSGYNPNLPSSIDTVLGQKNIMWMSGLLAVFSLFSYLFCLVRVTYGGEFFALFTRNILLGLGISTALLCLAGVLQRLDGTHLLLFTNEPKWNRDPSAVFSAFAYRANAAQYFNLIWPLLLASWFSLASDEKGKFNMGQISGHGSKYSMYLFCGVFIFAATLYTGSRVGGVCAILGMIGLLIGVSKSLKQVSRFNFVVIGTCVAVVCIVLYITPHLLMERISGSKGLDPSGRVEIVRNSLPIIKDYLWFGTGPGTFSTAYYMYKDPGEVWHAYMHNEFFEAASNFGVLNALLIVSVLVIFVRKVVNEAVAHGKHAMAIGLLVIFGCLAIESFVDFPFHIFSITWTFTVLLVLFRVRYAPAIHVHNEVECKSKAV